MAREERYYRFPYLREGATVEARTAADTVLTSLGYQNVPVSINNDDWLFNAQYLEALKAEDIELADRIAREYLTHMKERTAHFQNLAKNNFGRDVKHILLLHMNRINADHLDKLLDWYDDEGWSFTTLQEALTDPLYSTHERYEGERGLSQIERVLGYKSE